MFICHNIGGIIAREDVLIRPIILRFLTIVTNPDLSRGYQQHHCRTQALLQHPYLYSRYLLPRNSTLRLRSRKKAVSLRGHPENTDY